MRMKILRYTGGWCVNLSSIRYCNGYIIPIKNIGDTRNGLPDWLLHMAGKTWCNLDDFYTVFAWTVKNHPKLKKRPFTDKQLEDGLKAARNI